jgi:hypothetical protein
MEFKSVGLEIFLSPCNKCPYISGEVVKIISTNVTLYESTKQGSYRFVYKVSNKNVSCIQFMKNTDGKVYSANAYTLDKYRRKHFGTFLFREAKKYFNTYIYFSTNLSSDGLVFSNYLKTLQ